MICAIFQVILRKKGGYKRSVEMCEEYDIYRQCYCGCIFAAKQQNVDLKQVSQEAKAYLQAKKRDLKKSLFFALYSADKSTL